MNWTEIEIVTSNEAVDAISEILYELGISGVSIQDPHDLESFKEEFPFWDYIDEEAELMKTEDVVIKAYLSESENLNEILEFIRSRVLELKKFDLNIGKGTILTHSLKQQDWEESWKDYFQTFHASDRIVINPMWRKYTPTEDEIVINMDPGMAFGTGEHETTSMCIKLIEKNIKYQDSVLDIGCGSGILSIVAKKLGAGTVEAIDLDPVAVKVAKENIEYNQLTGEIVVKQGNLLDESIGVYDIVVANIMADAIIMLAKSVHTFINKDGIFIASGIISDKLNEVVLELRKYNFVVTTLLRKGEWYSLVAKQGEQYGSFLC